MFIVTWFFETLRHYPEIAIFLTLAFGYYFGKFTFKGIGLGSVTATTACGRSDRADRNYHLAAPEVHRLPDVPVRRWIWRRTAVRPRCRQGRHAASYLCGRPMLVLSSRPRRDRQVRRLRPGLCRRIVLRLADDLRRDGPLDRRHQPARTSCRSNQASVGLDADRLRCHIHFWNRGFRAGHCPRSARRCSV